MRKVILLVVLVGFPLMSFASGDKYKVGGDQPFPFKRSEHYLVSKILVKKYNTVDWSTMTGMIKSDIGKDNFRFAIESYDKNGDLLSLDNCKIRKLYELDTAAFKCRINTRETISQVVFIEAE